MGTWYDVGHSLNLRIKLEQNGKRIPFFLVLFESERETKRRAKSFLSRSMEFRQSNFVGPRTKVYRIDEGYTWVPKTRDFIEDPNEEFEKSKVSGLGSVHEAS